MPENIVYIGKLDPTPIGPLWAAVSARGLAAIEIGAEEEAFIASLKRRGFREISTDRGPVAPVLAQLEEYLAGERRTFDLPIDWGSLSAYQAKVLRRVCAVPYGSASTYGEIARDMGQPGAARAVGRANATNPMPLVIPCHRVLGADGALHGYGAPGGVETKAWLLRLEGYLF